MERAGPILLRYLQSRGRTWEAEVVRKRARRVSVTGWLDDDLEAGVDDAA